MSIDQSSKIQLDNVGYRLTQWRQGLQDNIESSVRKAIDSHDQAFHSPSLNDSQKLESEMSKVMDTALQKVDDMKKYKMDEEKIREVVLSAIQNMNSPYPSGSNLNSKFYELHQKLFDRVDAEIVGDSVVLQRNMRF